MPNGKDVYIRKRIHPICKSCRRTSLSWNEQYRIWIIRSGLDWGQTSVFEAAEQFARVEGILPAPESSHAIRVAIDEALKCKETGEEKTILFGLTGTGYFDMVAYEKYNNGEMSDYIPTDKDLEAGFAGLPKQPE